jgi:hypothetical protein
VGKPKCVAVKVQLGKGDNQNEISIDPFAVHMVSQGYDKLGDHLMARVQQFRYALF